MRVAKWGNSLAIRLPHSVVEALDLKEGEEVDIRVVGERSLELERSTRIEKAIERLRKIAKPLPEGFKFDREEANER
jgi:antitoxin MazE